MSAELPEAVVPEDLPVEGDGPVIRSTAEVEKENAVPTIPAPPNDSLNLREPRNGETESAPITPDPPRSETERLDPQPTELVLLSGTRFSLEPLKLRQFLRLLRIVTRGAFNVLDGANLNFEDPQEFASAFLGMILFAVPEAEEEAVDFVKSMVNLAEPTGDPKKDLIALQELYAELDNPHLEDTVTIIQVIIEAESEDLRALGKRLSSMLALARKVGQA